MGKLFWPLTKFLPVDFWTFWAALAPCCFWDLVALKPTILVEEVLPLFDVVLPVPDPDFDCFDPFDDFDDLLFAEVCAAW